MGSELGKRWRRIHKPTDVVSAVQWNKPGDHPDVHLTLEEADGIYHLAGATGGCSNPGVLPGDYIVAFRDGRRDVWTAKQVESTYEPDPDPAPSSVQSPSIPADAVLGAMTEAHKLFHSQGAMACYYDLCSRLQSALGAVRQDQDATHIH